MLTAICQAYVAILSTYHVASGALSFFWGPAALRFYRSFYGTDPVEQRHLLLILKPWGALSICAGLAGWSAAPDPLQHRGVVLALLVLLILRIVYRVAQRHELQAVSRIRPARNLANVALLALGAAILSAWLVWSS